MEFQKNLEAAADKNGVEEGNSTNPNINPWMLLFAHSHYYTLDNQDKTVFPHFAIIIDVEFQMVYGDVVIDMQQKNFKHLLTNNFVYI